MRWLLVLVIVGLLSPGCASLAWDAKDSTAAKTAKTVVRVPLAVATLGLSEMAIYVKKDRGPRVVWDRDEATQAEFLAETAECAMKAETSVNAPAPYVGQQCDGGGFTCGLQAGQAGGNAAIAQVQYRASLYRIFDLCMVSKGWRPIASGGNRPSILNPARTRP